MAQPATIIDAPAGETVFLGSQKITFPTAGQLVVEDLTFTKPLGSADFSDELGRDIRSVYSTKKGTGTMTVQFKTAGAIIGAGEAFNFIYQGGLTIPCIVTSVGNVFTQMGAAKCPITFAEYLDTSPLPKAVVYDGAWGNPVAVSELLISRPIAISFPIAYVGRQQFAVLRSSYSALALNSAGPAIGGQSSFLVEETELEDSRTAGIVTFWRVYATVPPTRTSFVSVSKEYIAAQYTWNSGGITDQSLVSWTRLIRATMTEEYYLDRFSVPDMPQKPFLQLIPYFSLRVLTDVGTGFPTQNYSGSGFSFTGYSNNFAPSFIDGSIEPYMGVIWKRTTIVG